MEYKIVYWQEMHGLTKAVNALIVQCWRPQGGVCITVSPTGMHESCYQAMIKD